jgi:pyruvate formate lyase activating enzyme
VQLGDDIGSDAELYDNLPNGRVRCTACARLCEIPEGKVGLCGVRGVSNGKLRLFVYGRVMSVHVDPIEKKPLSHYMPVTDIYSISTTGCNWLCQYCQNYDISQRRKVEGTPISPSDVVSNAIRLGTQGIAYTYNDPSIFIEYARDCGLEAHRKGLFNIFVSNGYYTPQSVRLMSQFLDCITVDFKGSALKDFVRRFIGIPDPAPIFQTLKEIRDKSRIHIEVTDLIVPGVGDSLDSARNLCKFVFNELGPETPIHFLRFHPDYKMLEYGFTPVSTLEAHHSVAKEEGLKYAYIGNVPGHPLENTFCPGCGQIAAGRYGFSITSWNMDENNRCIACGYPIAILGKLRKTRKRSFEFIY